MTSGGRIPAGIMFHREQWAGGGRPLGLKGKELPACARTLSVADRCDAMTWQRSCHPPREPAEAMKSVRNQAGTRFAPGVVDTFWRRPARGRLPEAA